jgi:spoIIIJ-associated protein
MDWVETVGKSVEEAKEAALDILGVDASEAQFEVLEEAKAGFLGVSKRPARVRARVVPSTPQSKDGRRQRRKPRPDGPRSGDQSVEGPNGLGDDETVGGEDRPHRPSEKRAQVNEVEVEGADSELESEEDVEVPSRMELAVTAQHFLADLLHELELAGTVAVDHLDEESMELSINGENLATLIGSKGAVLGAVQELTRAVVQTQVGDGAGRVTVDVAGYRQRRRAALERFTGEIVAEVLATGEERVFEPMIAAERKIVHDAVALHEGVESRSEGVEPQRYVVITKGAQ